MLPVVVLLGVFVVLLLDCLRIFKPALFHHVYAAVHNGKASSRP